MTQPTAYYPSYNFTQFQTANPSSPLPAASLDSELFNISASITEICDNLAVIQRDDGALANNSVGFAQLQSGISIGLAGPATNWATGQPYVVPAIVYYNNSIYICAASHTSSVFATDLAAGYWILMINTGQYVTAAAASATAAAASATSAASAVPNLTGTSATSITPTTGSLTFTTQAGKSFPVGIFVTITSNANPTVNWINGQVTSYSGTSLVVNSKAFGGSGAHTDWTINISGGPGPTGATGAPGPGTGDMLSTNNLSDVASASTSRTNLGLGSAAQQANSFFCQAANNLSDVSNAATAFANIKQVGTSGATGVLQLATNAEAITGTDTAKAVTSAGVAAAIAAHVSTTMTPLAVGSILMCSYGSPTFGGSAPALNAGSTTAASNLLAINFTTQTWGASGGYGSRGQGLVPQASGDSMAGTWQALQKMPSNPYLAPTAFSDGTPYGLFQRVA